MVPVCKQSGDGMPDAASVLDAAPFAHSFFDGFEEHTVPVGDGLHVFCRVNGSGPALLLLHGYPQTSAMWHYLAPKLCSEHTVICADLRGYGWSSKPKGGPESYSKSAMGSDLFALMDHFGIRRFLIGAHDRGARVAHRMAVDMPDRVRALATLDIAPTREMYDHATSAFAAAYWHWYWLIQPAPFPENLIGHDARAFWIKKCCSGSAGARPFVKQALLEYLTAFDDPATIRASCDDYRAAYGIDIEHDNAEMGPMAVPLLALWGANGAIEAHFDCLALWRKRAKNVQGWSLDGGHYLAEEVPNAVLDAWRPFFAAAP